MERILRMQMTIKTDEDIKHSCHVSQTRLKMMSGAMKHVLGTTHHREQGKSGFNRHAIIPSAFETQLQIVRNTCLTAKAQMVSTKPSAASKASKGRKSRS